MTADNELECVELALGFRRSADIATQLGRFIERKRAEEALIQSEKKLADPFYTAPPKVNGRDVIRFMKERSPGVKVIVTTGYLDPEWKSELFSMDTEERNGRLVKRLRASKHRQLEGCPSANAICLRTFFSASDTRSPPNPKIPPSFDDSATFWATDRSHFLNSSAC